MPLKKTKHIETYPEWKDAAMILGAFLSTRSYCPPGLKARECERMRGECADCWVDWAFEEGKAQRKATA